MSRKIIGVTVGTQLPKPNFKQTDPTKGDYIKNKPDFDGLKSRVTDVEEALEGKQPVGDYALKSEIPSIAGLATEDYVDEKIANHSALPEGASAHQMLVTDADGNAKWEDRIAYEEQTIATILPENTPTFNEDSGFLITEPLQHELVVGKSYTVIWNGVEYECEFEEYTLTSEEIGTMIARYFGDMSPMIGEDPKGVYPFCIVTSMSIGGMNQMPAGVYGACMPLDESTEITLSIKGEAFIVRKIPDKYLPEKTHWITEADIEIMPEQTFVNLSSSIVPVNAALTHDFVAGCQYTVTWNGVDYVCVAQEPTEFATVMLGNASALGGTSSTDPFLFAVLTAEAMQQIGGSYLISAFDGSTSATMKIMEPAGTVHKIDKKFLPDITAEDVGAVPETRTINGMALNTNIVLTASDINAVHTSRTINGKALSSNISLTAGDVGALPNTTVIPSIDGLASKIYVDEKVADLVDSSPDTLNTLNELAAALGDDPNFATTIATEIGKKVEKEDGKGLSTNDFTDAYKTKLDGLENMTFEETDPTVPAWAKAATKPTYTADEVGAEPKGAVAALNIANGTGTGSIKMDDATEASGSYSFAEGYLTRASGQSAHAEGQDTISSAWASHAEGNNTISSGWSSHAEGTNTKSNGNSSHAEGCATKALGKYSHAEGWNTIAFSDRSHAEGHRTMAGNYSAHAEGEGDYREIILTGEANATTYTVQNLTYVRLGTFVQYNDELVLIRSIDEENSTITLAKTLSSEALDNIAVRSIYGGLATGQASHVEGYNTFAKATAAHAEGYHTVALGEYSHSQGKYNIEDNEEKYAHIVGNGTSDTARSNAHTLDWDGNAWYQGDVYVGGTDQDNGSEKLMTQSEVMALIASILPTPTAADAGKILRVNAEGKYELVALPNAEEATF